MRTILAKQRILCVLAVLLFAVAAKAREDDGEDGGRPRWFSAWANSIGARMGPAFTGANFAPDLAGKTVRMIVRPTISGKAVRVKIENTQATTPVTFLRAFVGEVAAGAALAPGTNRQLTFGRKAGLTLAAGGQPGDSAFSDPVRFRVEAFARLAVSLEVATTGEVSGHQLGLVTNYMADGAVGSNTSGAGFTPVPDNAGNFPVYWVAVVDVQSSTAPGTIVTFGDSITDGRCSTQDSAGVIHPDQYNRWPDVLAARLQALFGKRAPAVANEGIAGNRIVSGGNGPPALTRVARDVLDRAGLRWVIFFEGTNDITGNATADTVITGSQTIIDAVHGVHGGTGVPIFGVTVVPRGRLSTRGGWNSSFEAQRLAVNHWMHTKANLDALIEFGALLQGPIIADTATNVAESLHPDFNCGDFTHPNTAGYQAMGQFIDLELFK
jgi:lysophospholipase L1-like esterase